MKDVFILFNYYGFTVRYCVPSCLMGKRAKQAKIFFGNHQVYEYNLNLKTNKPELKFIDEEMFALCKDVISALHEKYNTQNDVVLFTLQMLGFVEIYHYTKNKIKNKERGVIALLNEDNSLYSIFPITGNPKECLSKIQSENEDKKAYLFNNYKNFNVEEILGAKNMVE